MRIKVGESIEVKACVDVQYRCSSCGEENLSICVIKDSAYTPAVMGINVDQNLSGTAHESLCNKYDAIVDPNNFYRFRTAGFTCSCSNCGNIEPWADVNYEHLEKIKKIFDRIAVFSIVSLLLALSARGASMIWIPFLAIAVISCAIILGTEKFISKDYDKKLKLITELPQESLPTILPHSAQRYTAFNNKQSVKSYLRDITQL